MIQQGKEDEANAIASNGKDHGPNWLVGRAGTKSDSASTSKVSTEQQVQELAAKVRNIESELEANFNKRMQENMAWMLKKLEAANPDMTFNIEEVCATVSSEFEENGTPTTQRGATS